MLLIFILSFGLFGATIPSAIPFKSNSHVSVKSKACNFSSIITLGASFCDNGHARDKKFNSSLAKEPYKDGRHSNGQIWAEYLAETLQAHLYDYAYSGATSDDSHDVPDTADQMKSYISDLSHGKIGGSGALHVIWIGINSIYRSWQEGKGEEDIDKKVKAVELQMKTLTDNSRVNMSGSKFVVMTLPPLELVPNSVQIASQSAHPTMALERVKSLTRRYNQGLMAIQSKGIHVLDIAPFWRRVKEKPADFGFSCTTRACLDGNNICQDPGTYVYWDALHPTTKMHELIAERVQEFVENLRE